MIIDGQIWSVKVGFAQIWLKVLLFDESESPSSGEKNDPSASKKTIGWQIIQK